MTKVKVLDINRIGFIIHTFNHNPILGVCMPYKIMMTVAAIIPVVFGLAFLVVPQFFILGSYPNAEGLALEVGITQRYVMAGMLFIVLCLLFQSRNVEKVDDQKAILLGVSIGFAVMCAVIVVLEGPVRGLPLLVPPTIATGAIAILSFWSRTKLN